MMARLKSLRKPLTLLGMNHIKLSTVLQVILTLLHRILKSPVTYFNLMTIGVLIFIGVIHQAAHNNIEKDVHGYCYNYERTK